MLTVISWQIAWNKWIYPKGWLAGPTNLLGAGKQACWWIKRKDKFVISVPDFQKDRLFHHYCSWFTPRLCIRQSRNGVEIHLDSLMIRVTWCELHWFATSAKSQIEFDGCLESAGSTTISFIDCNSIFNSYTLFEFWDLTLNLTKVTPFSSLISIFFILNIFSYQKIDSL